MRTQRGFTLIELMVALTVLIIGLLGVMGIVTVSMRNSSFSRHGTEATVLAEDKIEELRTAPLAVGTVTETTLDMTGAVNTDVSKGIFTRTTNIALVNGGDAGSVYEIEVVVSWQEIAEATARNVTLRTERYQ